MRSQAMKAIGILFFLGWMGMFSQAEASEHGGEAQITKSSAESNHGTHDPHGYVPRFFLSAKFGSAAAFTGNDGLLGTLLGGSLSFEYALIPHRLELELEFHFFESHHGMTMPIDLILKFPFYLNSTVVFFVGIGATLEVETVNPSTTEHEVTEGEVVHTSTPAAGTYVGAGATAIAGADIWFDKHWGFVLEVHGSAVYIADTMVYDVGLNTGLMARW
ncbi:MAG: hypothetical protein H6728_00905 [Myxococcales bacterium]|nr:hypothetical protein [Myxococcales bacterium]